MTTTPKKVRHYSTAVEADVRPATAAPQFQHKFAPTSRTETARALELAEDVAAIKREADEVRDVPFSTFRTIDDFEQELES